MIKSTKNINTSKKITIDDLALMVAKGFSSMEERFDAKLDFKIDALEVKMDKGFDDVNKRLDDTIERLDRMETRHERKFDNLENRTITLKNHMENGFKKKLAW